MLPDSKCRELYAQQIAENPPPVEKGRESMYQWIDEIQHTLCGRPNSRPLNWGQEFWYVFQCTAATFPEGNASLELQSRTLAFFKSFEDLLPCSICREHYTQQIAENPPPVEKGREALVQWVKEIKQKSKKK
jgi:hypothetical protein